MNIHLPAILGFTRYQGFDPSPYVNISPRPPVGSPWFRRRLLDVVFGAVHEDPPVVLLAALGDDFTELEGQLP